MNNLRRNNEKVYSGNPICLLHYYRTIFYCTFIDVSLTLYSFEKVSALGYFHPLP